MDDDLGMAAPKAGSGGSHGVGEAEKVQATVLFVWPPALELDGNKRIGFQRAERYQPTNLPTLDHCIKT